MRCLPCPRASRWLCSCSPSFSSTLRLWVGKWNSRKCRVTITHSIWWPNVLILLTLGWLWAWWIYFSTHETPKRDEKTDMYAIWGIDNWYTSVIVLEGVCAGRKTLCLGKRTSVDETTPLESNRAYPSIVKHAKNHDMQILRLLGRCAPKRLYRERIFRLKRTFHSSDKHRLENWWTVLQCAWLFSKLYDFRRFSVSRTH